jgi:Mrp family chromosome partitioning ATPase
MLQLPDARAIGKMAGGVILVVRCGKTSRDAVVAASLRISEDGAKILGTVLNDWDPNALPTGRPVHNRASYKSFRRHYASKGDQP